MATKDVKSKPSPYQVKSLKDETVMVKFIDIVVYLKKYKFSN